MQIPSYQATQQYGYSCQTVIARFVNEYLHPGTYFCWMSEEFNPPNTGNSSNPSWLYNTLSHALHTQDSKDAKILQIRETLRTVLLEAVSHGWKKKANPELEKDIVSVRHAPLEAFRPQIWKIHLWKVEPRASSGQYRFEKLVKDLQWQEFEVIIE